MRNFHRLTWSILLLTLFFTSVPAQTRKPVGQTTTPANKTVTKEAAPTFDTLVASGNYGIYSEIRGVGQLIRSQGLNSILEPYSKFGNPPKEFHTLMRWLNVRAEALITSRMLCVSWPIKPKLPDFVCAIEFPSAEDAQKFEPQLRVFLPKVMPAASPQKPAAPEPSGTPQLMPPKSNELPAPPTNPPYLITQAGSLVMISRSPVDFKVLRPANSKLLVEDQHFRTARDRFTTEQVFLHLDLKGVMTRQEAEQRKAEERIEEERKKALAMAAEQKTAVDIQVTTDEKENNITISPTQLENAQPDVPPAEDKSTQVNENLEAHRIATATSFSSLTSLFMSGQSKWPEAVSAAVSFDDDSYNLRVLLLHATGVKAGALPFIPNLISGPPITPAAAAVIPADSNIFATFSLDYAAMHDSIASATTTPNLHILTGKQLVVDENSTTTTASPFAVYEKMLGIKLKEDLVPLLGNELAISLRGLEQPGQTGEKSESEEKSVAAAKQPTIAAPAPIIAISIRDKEAVKKLIPRMIEALGVKGAASLAQTERRADTELISYAGLFSYAFVGDFLLVSNESSAVRFAVDSYLKNETLGSDSRYRNFTRWQPRQVLGQVYMPSGTMDSYGVNVKLMEGLTEQMQQYLHGLGPITDPVTYSLSNEGDGPLHELRVPRTVLMAFVAGLTGAGKDKNSLQINEFMAQSNLRTFAAAQETYKGTAGNGSFGTVEQLTKLDLLPKEFPHGSGYRYEFNTSSTGFEGSATPQEYGKSGKASFFIDQTSVLRAGDHGGGPATISDKPVQ